MARKKEPAKPLFAVKHDFVNSLDTLLQEAVNLAGVLDMVLQHGSLPPNIKEIVAVRVTRFKAALFSRDDE